MSSDKEKLPKLWIYEYKDDETPIGATIVDEFIHKLRDEEIKLPHLSPEWHWRIDITYEEENEE